MTPVDIKAVHEVESAVYIKPWPITIFHDCLRVGYECHVMRDEHNTIMGYAIMSVKIGEGHIYNIAIGKDYQGQGLGTEFASAMVARAMMIGAKKILLEVRTTNLSAKKIYKKLGFKQIGVREGYYPSEDGAPREDALVYELKISL